MLVVERTTADSVAICVPVRNEALRLPRLLHALAVQDRPFTLCLLFDACTDASSAVVAEHASSLPFRIVSASRDDAGDANAGRARRAAMALGESVVGPGGLLVSTDADSVPAPNWLARTCTALLEADVVAGRVVRQGAAAPIQDRVETYYDALFALRRRLDPVPWEAPRTHHYASGASLAFHACAYAALSGFEPVPAGEDGRIVDAAHRAGLRVRRDAAIVVHTSSRRRGRASGGLADHLSRLDRGLEAPTMAHPKDCAWRYRAHAAARAAFGRDLGQLACDLSLPLAHVGDVAAHAPNAEAFATRIVPEVPGGDRIVSLDVAEDALARLEGMAREAA